MNIEIKNLPQEFVFKLWDYIEAKINSGDFSYKKIRSYTKSSITLYIDSFVTDYGVFSAVRVYLHPHNYISISDIGKFIYDVTPKLFEELL